MLVDVCHADEARRVEALQPCIGSSKGLARMSNCVWLPTSELLEAEARVSQLLEPAFMALDLDASLG
jgi:hypothetical protein